VEACDGIVPIATAVEGARVEAAVSAAVVEEGSAAAVEPGARRLEGASKWRQFEGGERHGGILSALGGRFGLAAVEFGDCGQGRRCRERRHTTACARFAALGGALVSC